MPYCQVNQVGPSDQIPLLVAAANGNVDLVKLLHESDADIDVQVRRYMQFTMCRVSYRIFRLGGEIAGGGGGGTNPYVNKYATAHLPKGREYPSQMSQAALSGGQSLGEGGLLLGGGGGGIPGFPPPCMKP